MSGDRYFINDQNEVHFLTFTIIDWMDIFIRKEYKDIIVDALNYCVVNKGLEIYAWCLMTSHLHLIARVKVPGNLSSTIRDFKSFTAKQVINAINKGPESRKDWLLQKFRYAGKFDKRISQYKFWQESNHAIALGPYDIGMYHQKVNYIHNNPVIEHIVEFPEEYVYSSAKDYHGKKGLVAVIVDDGIG
jgi:putative transposase